MCCATVAAWAAAAHDDWFRRLAKWCVETWGCCVRRALLWYGHVRVASRAVEGEGEAESEADAQGRWARLLASRLERLIIGWAGGRLMGGGRCACN